MKTEELLRLRNELIHTELGALLLMYLQDYITDESCKVADNSREIKGMCQLVQQIKKIPKVAENSRNKE